MLNALKRTAFAMIAAAAAFSLSSCAEADLTAMERIQNRLSETESCWCAATLTRISNKGENTYETEQYNKTTGEYRMEITAPENMAGNYTVFDGEKIFQHNARTGETVELEIPGASNGDELFFCSFIRNYMNSEDVAVDTSVSLDESRCTVLEAVIPGGNRYTATEKMWIDNETLKPLKFVIYDADGNERYIITYNEFEYDPEMDDSVFRAD